MFVEKTCRTSRTLSTALALGLVLFLIACGSSSTPPAPGPTPSFTSTAPAEASEGELYTYEVAATDPAGGPVTLSLQASPHGAVLNGHTLTWTPTRGQSRVANDFSIVATAGQGRTATQLFTVTPKGTIFGRLGRYFILDGNLEYRSDFNANRPWEPWVMAPNSDGWFDEIRGTLNEDGTYSIPRVPAGGYWLPIPTAPGMLESAASDVDLNTITPGRPDIQVAVPHIDEVFPASLLAVSPDSAFWYTPNMGSVELLPNRSLFEQTATHERSWMIQASRGDKTYLVHSSARDSNVFVADAMLGPLELEETAGATVNIDGTLSPIQPTTTVHPIIDLPAFDALQSPASVAGSRSFRVEDVPYDGPPASDLTDFSIWISYADSPDDPPPFSFRPYASLPLVSAPLDGGEPVDFGEIGFSNPWPGHTNSAVFEVEWWRRFPLGTQTVSVPYSCSWRSDLLPNAAVPIAPVIAPVSHPLIDGADLLQDQSGVSLSPVVSWAPSPTTQGHLLHKITPVALSPGGSSNTALGPMSFPFYTTGNQIKVPFGTLLGGTIYVFIIESFYLPDIDVEHTPFSPGSTVHSCALVSGLLTTAGSPMPSPASTRQHAGQQRTLKTSDDGRSVLVEIIAEP